MPASSRVVLAHHWLTGMRGGERVLEQISQLFPVAPIYTLLAQRGRLSARLGGHPISVSPLQKLPGAARHYRKMLPLYPWAVRHLRVEPPAGLVLSSDASVIKGLAVPEGVPHICYCHSPPRYLWDRQEEYRQSAETAGPLGRLAFRLSAPAVREFDRAAAQRVTHFLANSAFVAQRIKQYYARDAVVIHPPVELAAFRPHDAAPEDFYLVVSQLVPYKRIDLAVEACRRLGRNLVVIGDGSERRRLEAQAGPQTRFLGAQPDEVLQDHYRRCRALLFPGVEDFGIVPLEAQASGRPVIALGAGGALETVREGRTGLFFSEATPESLIDALERFERAPTVFAPATCRAQAERFAPERFRAELAAFIQSRTGLTSP